MPSDALAEKAPLTAEEKAEKAARKAARAAKRAAALEALLPPSDAMPSALDGHPSTRPAPPAAAAAPLKVSSKKRRRSDDEEPISTPREAPASVASSAAAASAPVTAATAAAYCLAHEVQLRGPPSFVAPPPMDSFSRTPFAPALLAQFSAAGYDAPTVTQALAWPIALSGCNLVSVAKTGSGKTLGFLAPAFHALVTAGGGSGAVGLNKRVSLLVMAPTRELAQQIEAQAAKFGRPLGLRSSCVYGGAPKSIQVRALREGAACVIGTPGRLQDLCDMGVLSLGSVTHLVLDEADRMLDMGFEHAMRAIIGLTPHARQTMLFTATWPRAVQRLAEEFAPNPVQLSLGDRDTLAANPSITQLVEVVEGGGNAKQVRLRALLKELHCAADGSVRADHGRTLIFVKFKAACNRVAQELWDAGFSVNTLHGDMEQRERSAVTQDFRSGKLRIVIATDVAARGLDIADLQVVINMDFPFGHGANEDYCHRIGRTGRAGATGVAHTFFDPREDGKHAGGLINILKGAKQAPNVFFRGKLYEMDDATIRVATAPTLSYPNLEAFGAPGDAVAARLSEARASLPLLVVGKSWCPFCSEVLSILQTHGASPAVLNIDTLPNGAAIHDELKRATGQRTVPYVFVGGVLLGGCSDVKAKQAAHELDGLLVAAKAVRAAGAGAETPTRARDVVLPPPEPPAASAAAARVYHPLFSFPDSVDGHVIRGVALQIFALAVAIVVTRETAVGRWLAVAVLIDFVLRLLAGAPASPLGVIAITCVARVRPVLSAGAPKQFAVIVGIAFSAAGTAALWADLGSSTDAVRAGGAVVWAVLALFAGLEGFLNFCAGCWVFGQAIRLGLLPATMYRIHVGRQAELAWQWEENMGLHDEQPPSPPVAADDKAQRASPDSAVAKPVVKRRAVVWAGSAPMLTDVTVRLHKDDAARRRDWSLLKHVKFGHFNIAFSLAGLAQLWRTLAVGYGNAAEPIGPVPGAVGWVLTVLAAAVWVILSLLVAAKGVLYPRRLIKDFWHPAEGFQASFPLVVLVLFANIAAAAPSDECTGCATLARVLFWLGSGPMLVLAFVRVADMIATPTDEDALNPSWMVAPVALLVAANAARRVDPNYVEVGGFFYAFALMWWAVLFFLMMSKRLRLPSPDCRLHSQYAGFVAAPAVAATAFVALTAGGAAAAYANLYPRVLLWMSLGFYCVLAVSYTRSFLGACCFSVMEWGLGFPTVKLAQALLEYHSYARSPASAGLAWAFLVIANITIFVLLGRTATALLRGGVFRNPGNWQPLQTLLYVDEAIVAFAGSFRKQLAEAQPGDLLGAARLAASWAAAEGVLHRQLLLHKNMLVLPAINALAHGVADRYIGLNVRSGERLVRAHAAVGRLLDAATDDERAAALSELRGVVDLWLGEELPAQLRDEREGVYPIAEKLLPLAGHKQLLVDAWEPTAWETLLPWVLTQLPTNDRRVRMLRGLQWAMPARTQQAGLYVARGVGAVQWAGLTRDMPALIPRGLPGHRQYL